MTRLELLLLPLLRFLPVSILPPGLLPSSQEDLSCIANVRQAGARGCLGTDQVLLPQDIVGPLRRFPGLKACVLFSREKPSSASGMDPAGRRLPASATKTRDSLTVLAETMGLGTAAISPSAPTRASAPSSSSPVFASASGTPSPPSPAASVKN